MKASAHGVPFKGGHTGALSGNDLHLFAEFKFDQAQVAHATVDKSNIIHSHINSYNYTNSLESVGSEHNIQDEFVRFMRRPGA